MRLLPVLILCVCLAASGRAQVTTPESYVSPTPRPLPEPDRRYQVLVGASVQASGDDEVEGRGRRYLCVGLYRTYTTYDPYHPDPFLRHGVAAEVSLGREPIYGLRYGATVGLWIVTAGAHVIYYTDGRRRDVRIRPEIGYGMRGFTLAAGYNARVYRDADFRALQPHSMQLSLRVFLGRSARHPDARPRVSPP